MNPTVSSSATTHLKRMKITMAADCLCNSETLSFYVYSCNV